MSTARRKGSVRKDPARAWIAAWVGGAAIGVANGALREGTYGRKLPEPVANAVSAATAIALFNAYFGVLQRRWPLPSEAEAAGVGGAWVALTLCFEFGLGRAMGKAWSELGREYDLRRGRLWPLVVLWIGVGPEVARRRSAR